MREHVVVGLLGKRYRHYPGPVRRGPVALAAPCGIGLVEDEAVPEQEFRESLPAHFRSSRASSRARVRSRATGSNQALAIVRPNPRDLHAAGALNAFMSCSCRLSYRHLQAADELVEVACLVLAYRAGLDWQPVYLVAVFFHISDGFLVNLWSTQQ